MNARSYASRGGWWVVGQFFLMFAGIALGPWFRSGWENGFTLAFGLTLLTLGAVAGIAGARDLGRYRTAFPKPKDDAQLVMTGVYGWMRHPLYTSVILIGFAWALLWASTPALIAAGATAVFLDLKARHEERLLREKFSDYLTYAARVKRFVPGVY